MTNLDSFTLENLSRVVDELGALKAAIAELTEKEKELKTIIAASGYAELNGELFRATVSLSERVTLDSEKVRALLSEPQIAACSRVTEVTSVRVASRKRATGIK
jgi:hypothetical protein